MRLKDETVRPEGLNSRLVSAIFLADRLHRQETGKELVITSLNDGKHKKDSLHYSGKAADLRIWELQDPSLFCAELAQALGDDFDVVLERDHIHLEYDPR